MEGRLVKLLLFESLTFNDAAGYKNSFLMSLAKLIYYQLNCLLIKSSNIYDFSKSHSGVVCVWQFRNEGNAIQREVDNGKKDWVVIHLEPHMCKGVNWRQVFWSNPFLLFKFLALAVVHVGFHSLRSFVHAYIGYLLYKHLLRINRGRVPKFSVLTTNMISPISIAVNEFARALHLDTYYLEHAITPQVQLHGVNYSRLFVRCAHTKAMLVDQGFDADRIEVNSTYSYMFPPEIGKDCTFRRIGIAINEIDSSESIKELVSFLIQKGFEVTIRLHDADKRSAYFKRIAIEFNAAVESATSRPVRDFLRNVDFVFVGNSSVLFDAVLAGVPVAYFWRGAADLYDYYGIVQAVGCPSVSNVCDIGGAFDFYYNCAKSC